MELPLGALWERIGVQWSCSAVADNLGRRVNPKPFLSCRGRRSCVAKGSGRESCSSCVVEESAARDSVRALWFRVVEESVAGESVSELWFSCAVEETVGGENV